MKTRMEKYYDSYEEQIGSRTKRNEELYKEISKSEIEKFEINSNATVLAGHGRDIDVEKIKKILDTKYKEAPRRRSIIIDDIISIINIPNKNEFLAFLCIGFATI